MEREVLAVESTGIIERDSVTLQMMMMMMMMVMMMMVMMMMW